LRFWMVKAASAKEAVHSTLCSKMCSKIRRRSAWSSEQSEICVQKQRKMYNKIKTLGAERPA
jgi:hypothetical protein